MKTLWVFAVFLTVTSGNNQKSRLVNTKSGPVRGYKDPEHQIYVFKSIPYASPPTGSDKFKAPLPAPTWSQPFEAVDKYIVCPQVPSPDIPDDRVMQENCLIVNVFVPDTDEKNLSVVFYVHGGCFQKGYGDRITPMELIVENNVIYVSFNYRLGIQGFLCLGTEDIPGNAGMKDQVAALRWVKDNIASFGGDPDDITLHGSSSGSACVDLLMLSRTTEGLFNKVILDSGVNVAGWSIQSDPLENAKWFARTLNFTNVDNTSALDFFYKTLPNDELIRKGIFEETDSTFVFAPCIERATKDEVFLDKSPVNILKSRTYTKVPLLNGITDMEGLDRVPIFESWKYKMNENFSDFLPSDLKFDSEEQKQEIAKQIKHFYFDDSPVENSNILKYIDYFTDIAFAYPAMRSVKYHLDAGNDQIYLYEYSFVDKYTRIVPYTNVKGAEHCAQIRAVFNSARTGRTMQRSEEFKRMSIIMRNLWGNFVRTGAPVSRAGSRVAAWPPVRAGSAPLLSLGNNISLRGALLERRMRFWDDIYSKHYRDPVSPLYSA